MMDAYFETTFYLQGCLNGEVHHSFPIL